MSEHIHDFYLNLYPMKVISPSEKRTFKNNEKAKLTVSHESGFGFNIEFAVNTIKREWVEEQDEDSYVIKPYEDFNTYFHIESFGIDKEDEDYFRWYFSALIHAKNHEQNNYRNHLDGLTGTIQDYDLYFPSFYRYVFSPSQKTSNNPGSFYENLIYRNKSCGISNIGDFYFDHVTHPFIIIDIHTPKIKQEIDIIVRDNIFTVSAEFNYLNEDLAYNHYDKVTGLHKTLSVERTRNFDTKLDVLDIEHADYLTEKEKLFIKSKIYELFKRELYVADFFYDGKLYPCDMIREDEKNQGSYLGMYQYKNYFIRTSQFKGIKSNKEFITESGLDDNGIIKLNRLYDDCMTTFKNDSDLIQYVSKDILFSRSISAIEPKLNSLKIIQEISNDNFYHVDVECSVKVELIEKYEGTITLDHNNKNVISDNEIINISISHEIGDIQTLDLSVISSTIQDKFNYEITPSDMHILSIEILGKIMDMSDQNELFFEDYYDVYMSLYHLKHIELDNEDHPFILGEILIDKVIHSMDKNEIILTMDSRKAEYVYGDFVKNKGTINCSGFFFTPDILDYNSNLSERQKMQFTIDFNLEANEITSINVLSYNTDDVEFLSDNESIQNPDYQIVRFVALHIIFNEIIKEKGIYWALQNETSIYQSIMNL